MRGDSTIPLGTFLEGYLVPGGDYYHEEDAYGFPPGHEYRYCNVGAEPDDQAVRASPASTRSSTTA